MSPLFNFITTLFSLLTLIADIGILLLVVWLGIWYVGWRMRAQSHGVGTAANARAAEPFRPLVSWVGANAVGLGLIVSTLAVLGSLFFSNVVGFVPCELCWWQRIFIYPQVIIFFMALMYERRGKPLGPVFSISGVLSVATFLISAFQYYGATFNAGALAACNITGVSCAKTYFVDFGYVTIPIMSLTTAALLLAIVMARRFK